MKLTDNNVLKQIVKMNASYFPDAGLSMKELKRKIAKGGKVFCRVRQGRVQGYVLTTIRDDACWVSFIGIRRENRGQGLGYVLLKRAVKWALNQNYWIFTYASVHNIRSINLLIKCGFRVESIGARWINLRHD